mgnify:CR=1 FL=1
MLEAENFKVKISTGNNDVDSRMPCDFRNITIKSVFKLIDSKDLPIEIKEELKKMASKYPHQALDGFIKGMERNIVAAQKTVMKKQIESPPEKKELEFPE